MVVSLMTIAGALVTTVSPASAAFSTPSAPLTVQAVRGNGTVTVTWKAPATNGGLAITGYQAILYPGPKICNGTNGATPLALTCTVAASNFTEYTVKVTAVNALGSGVTTQLTVPAADLPAPSRPTVVSDPTRAGGATVSWAPSPDVLGDSPQFYIVNVSPPTSVGSGQCRVTAPATTCSAGLLARGTTYTFTITTEYKDRSNSNLVSSPPSVPSAPFNGAYGPPSEPRNVVVTPGDGQLLISWSPPADDGGQPITGYTAWVYRGSTFVTNCSTTITTACSTFRLVNDVQYTVKVTAKSVLGVGAEATTTGTPKVPVPPVVPPGAPSNLSVDLQGDSYMGLSWSPPADNGNGTVSSYTVTSSPDAKTCTTTDARAGCVVWGLTPGVAYTFSVTATNEAGTGAASASTAPVTIVEPPGLPSEPQNVSVSVANRVAVVSWLPPASDGGAAIERYVVADDQGHEVCAVRVTTPETDSCRIPWLLVRGQNYRFHVFAQNSAGDGPAVAVDAYEEPLRIVLNPQGGTTASNGLKVTYADGQIQVERRGDGQLYAPEQLPPYRGMFNYFALGIGSGRTGTLFVPPIMQCQSDCFGSQQDSFIDSTDVRIPDGFVSTMVARYTDPSTRSVQRVTLEITGTYRSPSDSLHLSAKVTLPAGMTQPVKLYHVLDTYFAGSDNGPGYYRPATNACTSTQLGVYQGRSLTARTPVEAMQHVDGLPWTSYVEGYYYDVVFGGDTGTFQGQYGLQPFANTVDPSLETDNAIGIEYSLGTGAGSYVTSNNLTFGEGEPPCPATNVKSPPSAVIDPTAVAGNAQATVTWSPPSSDGGSPITSYNVTASPGGRTCTYVVTSPETDTCTVTGLTNGTTYKFDVTAINGQGPGTKGTSNKVVPLGPPSVPLTPRISSVTSTTATITWSPSASDGGTPITAYTVVSSPGGQSCTTIGLSCVITGLPRSTAFSATITATNIIGTSPAAIVGPSSTLADAPSVVLNPTAVAGNAQATVTWQPPADTGGSPITGYTVTSSPGLKTCTTSGALVCTVFGLTNGTRYSFQVKATTGAGDGPEGASNQVTPSTIPGAPINPTADAGNAQATITWSPPASNGGSRITGYTVTSTPGGLSCTTTGDLSCTITGLTNGTPVSFRVTATNANGTGPASVATLVVTPVAPLRSPSAVLNPTAVAGNAQATVSWNPPASDGGSPITSYTVISSPGSGTCTYVVANPETDTCTVTGLTNGTTYVFDVVANNITGTGPAGTSNPVTPMAPPSAVLNPTAVAGNAQATVSWRPPADDGGSPITSYTAISSPGGFSCTYTVSSPETDACTVTGLTNGTTYTFDVTAVNEAGTGPAGTSNPVVPMTVPSAPISPTAVASNGSVVVTWSIPASDGGSRILGYKVVASPGAKSCSTSGSLTCTVTGLTNGTTYTFTVVARNVVGAGPPSAATPPVTPAAAPGVVLAPTAVAGNAQATISWTPPASDGGSPITSYTVVSSPGGRTCTYSVGVPETDTCTVTGLINGTPYTFLVTATNDAGTGPAGTSNRVTPSTVPEEPRDVSAIAGDGQAVVAWSAPSYDGGSPVTAYAVVAEPGGQLCTTEGGFSCTIVGLTNGVPVTFSFTATNANGTGPAAILEPSVTPLAPPSVPLQPSVAVGVTTATVTWSVPATDGGSPITGYSVTASHGAGECTTTGALSCTIAELTPGVHYRFHITATNLVGDSPAATTAARVGALACSPGLHFEIRHGLLESTTDFGTWTTVGTEDGFVNALGYRPEDGFLYGVGSEGGAVAGRENHLLRIAGDGTMSDLGTVEGLPTLRSQMHFAAGAFDGSTDRLLVAHGRDLYAIDVDTKVATPITLPDGASPIGWGMAISGDWLWSVTGAGVQGINLVTQAVTSYALPSNVTKANFGAVWIDPAGTTLTFEANASGEIYQASGLGGPSITGSTVGSRTQASRLDGASCPGIG